MAGNDYVQIELSPAGVAMAGQGGYVSVNEGGRSFSVKVGETQRVTLSFDWQQILSKMKFQGQPIFQIATSAPAASAAPSPPAKPAEAPNHPGNIWPPAAGAADEHFAPAAQSKEKS